jgi:hypothetical protein
MNFTRVLLAAFLLFVIVGCGKGKKQAQQPAAQPQPITQNNNADALFDEFFDNSPTPAPEPARTMPAPRIEETFATAPREVRFSPNGRFVVQVSTIASPTLADEIVRKLERQGFPAYSVSVENPTTELIGTYYRVRIGGFDGINDARYFGENMLRPLGYDFWVDNRSNDRVGIGGSGLGSFYPKATDYDAPTAPTPAPATVVQEEQWGTVAPMTEEIQPTPAPAADDNNWDNFEW